MPTGINWTDEVWNPITGCAKVSPGCDHCYALSLSNRWQAAWRKKKQKGTEKYNGTVKNGDWSGLVRCHPEVLDKPLRWIKPRRIFVCSMSDLFHHDVHPMFRRLVCGTMEKCPQHIFQVLTKRPEQMHSDFTNNTLFTDAPFPLPNLWLGVTAENQKYADKRIPLLLNTPAAVRFISAEPLLGPLDIRAYLPTLIPGTKTKLFSYRNNIIKTLDWVIIGCESGPNRRPCKIEWIESLVDQCQEAEVDVWVKQVEIDGVVTSDVTKFPEHLQLRESEGVEG